MNETGRRRGNLGTQPQPGSVDLAKLAAAAKSLQSCPTLCDTMDYSLPGSSSMGFSRQECWSGLSCPPPGDLPDPGIDAPLMSPALIGRFFTTNATWEKIYIHFLRFFPMIGYSKILSIVPCGM